MACERTSRRVAKLASKQLRIGRRSSVRSVAASALRARRKSSNRKVMTKRA